MANPETLVNGLRRQLKEKFEDGGQQDSNLHCTLLNTFIARTCELEKEIALRKLLNEQKDEQAWKFHAAIKQVDHLTAKLSELTTHHKEKVSSTLCDMKEKNQQLTDEIQALKLSQAHLQTANSANVAAENIEKMEQLSYVYHAHEEALKTELMEGRKEKREAVSQLQELGNNKVSIQTMQNKGLREALQKMKTAEDSFQLQQKGNILINRVRALKEIHQEDISSKIALLSSERDQAERKVQSLMSAIFQLQKQLDMMETEYKLVDKTRVKALQAQLLATTEERDLWQQKAAKFEDTIETLRVISSLQRSLSKGEDMKRKFELELQKCYAKNEALKTQLEQVIMERNHAVSEMNQVVRERNNLAIQAQQEYERAERFQRLVLVLRKKTMTNKEST